MQMCEYVKQISFMLGLPTNENIEDVSIEQGVLIAFQELKRYMKTPVNLTVPFNTRLDLPKLGINTVKVLSVQAAYPKVGMSLGSVDSGNVFQVATAVSGYTTFSSSGVINIDPILTELSYSQVQNTLSTDFQWTYDLPNQVVYCTHRSTKPQFVTVRYVPIYTDVSEITNNTWIDYLVRLGLANVKTALGRSRSKYTIAGSNVTLDGEALLAEANAEFEAIRSELKPKSSKLVVLK